MLLRKEQGASPVVLELYQGSHVGGFLKAAKVLTDLGRYGRANAFFRARIE